MIIYSQFLQYEYSYSKLHEEGSCLDLEMQPHPNGPERVAANSSLISYERSVVGWELTNRTAVTDNPLSERDHDIDLPPAKRGKVRYNDETGD